MTKILLATTILIAGIAASSAAMAQIPDGTGARADQLEHRDQNQQNRINRGEADGQLNPNQAKWDQARLNHQEEVQRNQEAANGGRISKDQERHDDRNLNKNSHKIHHQRHDDKRHHHRK